MKNVGDIIDPATPLTIYREGEEASVTLGELLDRPTVVSIYMKNNTGSCDKQNISLADHAAAIAEAGYNLVAVSRDSAKSHSRYADKLKIDYVLASDPEDQFAQAADAIVEKKMYGKTYEGPARAAFVLDETGQVKAVIPKVKAASHGEELLEVLKAL